MALSNLISLSFTDDELSKIKEALNVIENILTGKTVNLSPEERQLYGKLGNKTENWVRKVSEYMEQKPNLIPFYLDKAEFDRDVAARNAILPLMNRISSVYESLDDTAKLLSTDVYNAAIAYYRNIKLISQQNVPGTTHIYQDLAGQFPGRSSHTLEEFSTKISSENKNVNNNDNQ